MKWHTLSIVYKKYHWSIILLFSLQYCVVTCKINLLQHQLLMFMCSCSKSRMALLFWDISVIIRMAFKSNGVLHNPQWCQCHGWKSIYSSKLFAALCSCRLFGLDMEWKSKLARSGLFFEAIKNVPTLFLSPSFW